MSIPDETLKAMARDLHGFDLTDEELEIIRPGLDDYMAEVEKLRELDLSSVMSVRLLQAKEGGAP